MCIETTVDDLSSDEIDVLSSYGCTVIYNDDNVYEVYCDDLTIDEYIVCLDIIVNNS